METFEQSEMNSNRWTLSLEDSLAKTFPPLAHESESTEADLDCGLSSFESFAFFDRNSFSWRTFQGCLIEGWDEYSETWPRAGLMRSGACYRRPSLDCPTAESESSLLPTPGAQSRGLSGSGNCATAKRLIGRDWYCPDESEMFMGFPIGWTESPPAGTP
jgi:hypothetical protein